MFSSYYLEKETKFYINDLQSCSDDNIHMKRIYGGDIRSRFFRFWLILSLKF